MVRTVTHFSFSPFDSAQGDRLSGDGVILSGVEGHKNPIKPTIVYHLLLIVNPF